MAQERRRYKRFSPTAFLNMPVHLEPLPPFFGHDICGKLIDLSASGLAILINEIIPQETFLELSVRFHDQSKIHSIVQIKNVRPKNRSYIHGIEFINLSATMAEKIDRMSSDYIDCENRIQKKVLDVCKIDCAFYTLCSKKEKKTKTIDTPVALELAFQIREESRPV